MANHVAKVIELVGTSDVGWQDAVETAVRMASRTLHGITGVEVTNVTAKVQDGKIVAYKATVKLGVRCGRIASKDYSPPRHKDSNEETTRELGVFVSSWLSARLSLVPARLG